jgi:hypothetical protein
MTVNRFFAVLAVVVVAAGLVLAFVVIGPPSHTRSVALDKRRVADLYAIGETVRERFKQRALPAALPASVLLRDPETHAPYGYRRIDAHRYELCATFATASEADAAQSTFRHAAGRSCYRLDVRNDVDQATPVEG